MLPSRGHCQHLFAHPRWPNELWFNTFHLETRSFGSYWTSSPQRCGLCRETQRCWLKSEQAHIRTYLTYVQYVRRDLSSPQLTSFWGLMLGMRLQEWWCTGGTNKRLSEKSSHCATVNCQLWYKAGALILPADKVGLVRSAEPLQGYMTAKRRVLLQQHPLGEGFLAAREKIKKSRNRPPCTFPQGMYFCLHSLLYIMKKCCFVHRSGV